MAKIKMNVTRLSAEDLVLNGRNIVTMMTGNPVYIEEQSYLPALAEACDRLASANQEVMFNGGLISYQNKRDCEAALRDQIIQMVARVQVASGGVIAHILSAGFGVRKMPEPSKVPSAPAGLKKVPVEKEGTIKLRWFGQKNVRFYKVEVRSEEGVWLLVASTTRASQTITDLEPGRQYFVRVTAASVAGESPASGAIVARAA